MVLCQAGTTLQQLSSTMDPITVESVALLVAFALLSLGRSSKTTSLFINTRRCGVEVWFLSPNRPGSNLGLGPPQFSQGAADQTVILYINNIKKH